MCIKKFDRTRAYIKIQDGCESHCTYCIIPQARGKIRSKPFDDVISEVKKLSAGGCREIVLTGIETGSYGKDMGYSLADLLEEIDKIQGIGRIRLGSLDPSIMKKDFIERIAKLDSLAHHFHVSMQSGSDKVLRAMKRRYNRRMALDNIARIRSYMPDVMFTADLMVGFPGEEESDFLDTVNFVKEAQLLDAHVFAYSKRHDTPAAAFECQIPEEIKRKRSEELIRVAAEVRDSVLDRIIARGKPLPCIFESKKCKVWFAHSHNFATVAVKGDFPDLAGESRLVTPLYRENGIIFGEITK
jgi:threonylcarbamoyladenosine tRNA methylthiotransferase MtaB